MGRKDALSERMFAVRSIGEHLRDYDWDGSIAESCSDIASLLTADDYQMIAGLFWRQYL